LTRRLDAVATSSEAVQQHRLTTLARSAAALRCSADPFVLADVTARAAATMFGERPAVVQIRPAAGRPGAVGSCHLDNPDLLPDPPGPDEAWTGLLGETAVVVPIPVSEQSAGLIAAAHDGIDETEAQWLVRALAAHLGEALASVDQSAGASVAFAKACDARLGSDPDQRSKTFSVMGHDFRSPLASLQIGCDMLQRMVQQCDPGVETQDIFQAMRAAAKHVAAMAENLVELCRLDKGVADVQPIATDLEPILQKAMDSVAQRAAEAGVTLQRQGAAPGRVMADPDRLVRVVANLLSNAVDFSPPDGGVTLTAERRGEEVVLTVQDAGPGVAPELRGAIFEPFVQGRTEHGLKAGLGLGLALSRTLVRRMGGDLVLAHAEPGATKFRLTLPTG
jgi:signal transduction histidine kinase